VIAGREWLVVQLSASVVRCIVEHARREAPRECCGLLVGTGGAITDAVPARNIADRPTRFLIDPQDHIDALRDARRRGLAVLGFYHSHPNSSAVPSEIDRAEVTYPDHLYLIAGLASEPPEIAVYTFADGNFQQLAVVTDD
jgi:proteasome lid subunit RPN8/RPN11